MPFSFKQFHIDDSRCGMPVSTDGVLLGAWAPLTDAKTILDIGAGSGLLSLMARQRSQAKITAIELDQSAALDCQYNFNQSPWSASFTLLTSSIQQYCTTAEKQRFDHIICNPPYFDNGPQSSSSLRATARHTDRLSFDELLGAICFLLSPAGQASLILPTTAAAQLLSQLKQHSLACKYAVAVSSVEGKVPNRQLLLLNKTADTNMPLLQKLDSVPTLAIRQVNGQYTDEFVQLTKSFYLKL
ncbi:methyltransferase [Shewanella sp. KX20019]|uniref:tRNA1(Val) (adenine(37)-N6)-methyltransferase n=1 Tax=Shewanella sp. KX20019 TaxID=2803864 RepID=UPI00192675F8|nr:methyltransferase [Shewanella sp. KX20019]QQX82446.1 methyltransferase [Shewanella sp. KX20019]